MLYPELNKMDIPCHAGGKVRKQIERGTSYLVERHAATKG